MSVFRGANPFDQLTPGVQKLLIANVGIFLAQIIFPDSLVYYLGLTPALVMKKFWIWQIFTYAYLHANGWHLFFNMFSLWMFAPHIEAIWGTRAFMRYYVVCATGAALAQFAVAPNSLVIGASGAIYGLLIAFGFMFPDVVIYLFFVFPLRAIQAVFFIALLTLVMATGSGGSRIAHVAHLGGLLTGLVYLKAPMWWQQFRLWRADARFRNPLGRRRAVGYDEAPRENDMSDEVDRILEKISAHGVGSLTSAEHATMQKYAQRKK